MRVQDKRDKRKGTASIPPKLTVLPAKDVRGFILNGKDWAVHYDDGDFRIFSPQAFEMVFSELPKDD